MDGKKLAIELNTQLKSEVQDLVRQGVQPKLVVIVVGDDPASAIYVRNKHRQAEKAGIESVICEMDGKTTQTELLDLIKSFNQDESVDGILVQLPLPDQIDSETVLESIDPTKDVDGFHPFNIGKLWSGHQDILPSTPAGIVELLKTYNVPVAGQNVVVVGRSVIVGRPMAALMLNDNATITICHSKTRELSKITREADILIVAIGQAELIRAKDVKPGATVIDVGMNHNKAGHLVGDVAYSEVEKVAANITPVPGGVGPMTIAMLMHQTVELAKRRIK